MHHINPKHVCKKNIYTHTSSSIYKEAEEEDERAEEGEKSRAERAMESTMNAFIKYQPEAEKREELRWKKELELEEKRRREDQQHELWVMQMIGQMLQQQRSYPPSNSSPYDFNYDETF